jgi:hypothetical protein
MPMNKTVFCAALLFGSIALAQPIPVYKDEFDYCYKNPNMPTCRDGKPIDVRADMEKNMGQYLRGNANAVKPLTLPAAPQVQTAPTRVTPQITRVPRGRPSASPAMIQVGQIDWRFAHPHPDLLIGVDMENLLASDLMRTLLRDWAGKLGATPEEQDKMLAGLGDAKKLLISIYNREILAMMVGNVGNLPQGTQAGGLKFTRLSEDTALMGSEGGSSGALTRLKLAALPNAQQDEAKLMAGTYDFWAWGRADRLASVGAGTSGNTPVKKIKIGVSLRDGFNLQFILDTPDAGSAARLLESMQKGTPRGMRGAVEGNSVRYAMVLDRDAALQRFAGLMTDSVGKQFAPLIAAARQMSARQGVSPRPAGKIIIDGLDDGPKEVPVAQRH